MKENEGKTALFAHLYIHLPFCRWQICPEDVPYTREDKTSLVWALLEKELSEETLTTRCGSFQTIYVGGGVPSHAPDQQLAQLFSRLHALGWTAKAREISLEADPAGLDLQRLALWRQWGITRVNLLWTETGKTDLPYRKPAHVLALDQQLRAAGLEPTHEWAFPTHLSGSAEARALDSLLSAPGLRHFSLVPPAAEAPISRHEARNRWKRLYRKAQDAGFLAYELTHFGKGGTHGRQNLAVYRGEAYLGLGPGATSSDGGLLRQFRPTLEELSAQDPVYAYPTGLRPEKLRPEEAVEEWLWRRLRLREGLDLRHPPKAAHKQSPQLLRQRLRPFLRSSWLALRRNRLFLTEKGRLHWHTIAKRLLGLR